MLRWARVMERQLGADGLLAEQARKKRGWRQPLAEANHAPDVPAKRMQTV